MKPMSFYTARTVKVRDDVNRRAIYRSRACIAGRGE